MNVLENFRDLFLDVWKEGVSGVNISEIIIALIIFIFFLFLRGVFSKFVIKRLEKYVSKTTNKFDNSLVYSMEGPAKFFPIVLGFFVSTSYLSVEHGAIELINRSLITILIFWSFHQIIGPFSVVIKSVGGLLSKDLITGLIILISSLNLNTYFRSSCSFRTLGNKDRTYNSWSRIIWGCCSSRCSGFI